MALEGRNWLAGEAYSLAEAAYTPYITRLDHLNITRLDHLNLMGFVDGYPNPSDWCTKVSCRPSYAAVFGDWNEEKYLTLMTEKGTEAWPQISGMIA